MYSLSESQALQAYEAQQAPTAPAAPAAGQQAAGLSAGSFPAATPLPAATSLPVATPLPPDTPLPAATQLPAAAPLPAEEHEAAEPDPLAALAAEQRLRAASAAGSDPWAELRVADHGVGARAGCANAPASDLDLTS